ncbi:ATP-binding protein [Hymenobacter sp. BT770]|uniref:tetratricopeptide repeat-containing sensor histidine kinase n=1 Tax=Hymenobacter sp. BT770 TaxID=2886942 RepID=UPI001D110D53|nr:ATP-binding protein [Hymenobacter sp. BT770]MCC3155209.1 histidine kinase [Hymenobacter sp. BT770]MDO3417164.1 ATP-binding protein [Hymenobacter sp. BT770]
MRYLLLLALLWLAAAPAVQAQTTPAHRYWEADGDSLRRVLDTQRADTARLRTLLHMSAVGGFRSAGDLDTLSQERIRLLRRLKRPEARAFELSYADLQLSKTKADPAVELTRARATIEAFDSVSWPILGLLSRVGRLFLELNQPEERIAYFQAKVARYEARGARENLATSYHLLGAPFVQRGDYNQAIGHYLRSADLYRTFRRTAQVNELKVVGAQYAEWGNPAKALVYLQQSLAVGATLPARTGADFDAYTYRNMAQAYRQLGNYPAALRHADLALAGNPADTTRRYAFQVPIDQAYGLVTKSAVLLDLRRAADVAPLLARAQQLADSLKIPLDTPNGYFEFDATWARYYAAQDQPARAEQAWLTAYRKARELKIVPLRLAYLRALADFYAQRGQPEPAGRYARLGLSLADSLRTQQGAFQVAGYEAERAEQVQQQRIAALRLAQVQDAARARRQRLLFFSTLAVLALLAGLGFVLWRANRQKQHANEQLSQLNEAITRQKHDLQSQRDQLDMSLTELRATQAQLIQKEKMASLGELTAGIAHEIQNPLNFVNNFSEVSAELVAELQAALAVSDTAEAAELAGDVAQNLGKITEHGKRAAAIVKGMLEHSRASTGERAPTDLNALADEYLRLAYQGLRAKDKTFNATLTTDFAPDLPLADVVGADVGRVLLNLFSNAFYAVRQRQQMGESDYVPTVHVLTKQLGQQVEIRVKDNGTGMSEAVQGKIFQPFFTTKPTGEGTGLGLSLSHDIIAQGHGGTLSVESQQGEGTTFSVALPLNGAAH